MDLVFRFEFLKLYFVTVTYTPWFVWGIVVGGTFATHKMHNNWNAEHVIRPHYLVESILTMNEVQSERSNSTIVVKNKTQIRNFQNFLHQCKLWSNLNTKRVLEFKNVNITKEYIKFKWRLIVINVYRGGRGLNMTGEHINPQDWLSFKIC